jgi:hypothetical protein
MRIEVSNLMKKNLFAKTKRMQGWQLTRAWADGWARNETFSPKK